MQETINDHFNIDFDYFYDFLYENQNTNNCDLEAKLNECLKDYLD